MKKFLLQFTMLCAALVVMVSCKSDEAEVKKSAEGFLHALKSGDLDKAKEFTTDATQAKWNDFATFAAKQMTPAGKQAIADLKINVSEVKVQGETAEALCSATIPYLVKQITVLHFVKVGDKWLVNEPDAIVSDVIHLDETVTVLDTDSIPTQAVDGTKVATEPAKK